MSIANLNAQELLNEILVAGKDLISEGKSKTGNLTNKGKELAKKGEDVLIDKLDIEDTELSRDALRKGVGAGAAAGALALLLSSRSGRKLATLGGLSALGVVAYKAHKNGKMPTSVDDVIGLLKGPAADDRADVLVKAMIAAAHADGELSEAEMKLLEAYDGETKEALQSYLSKSYSARDIAALSSSKQEAAEIYAISCRIADGLNPAERNYLDALAMGLGLDPELAALIETEVRTG